MGKTVPSISDSAIIELARNMHKAASDNIATFTAFDASLDAAWLTNWNNEINAAENIDSDESYTDEFNVFTARVNSEITNCLNLLRDIKYYAGKAHGQSAAAYRVFRFPKLHEMAKSTPRFIIYCGTAHRFAVSMNAALLAVGMPAGLPADFFTAISALTVKELDKEVFIQSRLIVTEQRTALMNTVYEYMQGAHAAASNIYRNQPEMIQLFDLPQAKRKEKEE